MFRTALNGLRANKLRFTLTTLSVVLGVAFVAGSFVFTDTINARFESLFTDVYAGVDATVRPDADAFGAEDPYLDEPLLSEVTGVEGVETAAGGVAGFAQLIDADGEPIGGQGPPTLGFSWVEEPRLNLLRIEDANGRAPETAGEIAIDIATAEGNDLSVGDDVVVQTINGADTFTIVGLANFGSEDNLAGATITAFELGEAQRLFDMEGKLSSIDVIAEEGITQEELVETLAATTPERVEVVTGDQQTQEEIDEFTEGLGFLNTALLAFAGVAVFVGAFVIQNTFRITVAQRVRELALLRAVGATGSQVTRMVLIEAAVLAVVASAIGVLAGIGLAELIKGGMDALGMGVPDGPLTVEARTVIVAMTVGTVVTLVSALIPARRAAAIPPVAAMSQAEARTTRKSLRTRAGIGIAVTVVGVALMVGGLLLENGASLALVSTGAIGLFLGMSILAPLVAGPAARLLSAPLRGITGKLARENTIRQPRRTASTASALMIGVALVAFVSIFAASIKVSATENLEESFPADLSFTSSNVAIGVSPAAVDELKGVDDFDAVSAVHTGYFSIDGEELNVAGVDPATIADVYNVETSTELTALSGGMMVSEPALTENGWSIGDVVTVEYEATGEMATEIVGSYEDQNFGNYLISETTFVENIGDDQIMIAFVRLADGVALEDGKVTAEAALVEFPNVAVDTKADFIADAEAQIDQMVGLFSALLGLALVIALLGIANTLALSIVERTREIGLLRAVGMGRRQVRSMIRWEAIVIALFGALMGVLIGSAIGFGVIRSLADDGLGTFAFPGGQLAIWLIAAALAGILASIGPARKAARLDVLKAISYE
ncbi:MAG: FtsX-like permease family protein [Acidimicrobiia bacterium]|jgi:putative ABC transport system permease protein